MTFPHGIRPNRRKWAGFLGCGGVAFCAWATFARCEAAVVRQVTVRELIETREIANPSVSPDGRFIAFLVESRSTNTNTVRLTWYIQRLKPTPVGANEVADGGAPLRFFTGPLLPGVAIWSPDSHWIYYEARKHGEVQVWRVARGGGVAQRVTNDPGDVKSFGLSADGHRLYYVVGAPRRLIALQERREYIHGVLLTPNVEVYEPVLYNQPNYDGTRTTQRRDKGGTFQLLNSAPKTIHMVTLGQPGAPTRVVAGVDLAEYRKAVSRTATDDWYALAYGQDGRYLATTKGGTTVFWQSTPTGKSSGNVHRRLYQLVRITDGSQSTLDCESQVCRDYVGQFTAPQWRPGSNEVVWAHQSALGATTLYAWDVGRNTVRKIYSSDALLGGTAGMEGYFLMGCPVAANEALCVTSAARSPPELEEINLDTGSRRIIFDPNSKLRTGGFGVTRELSWKDRWGKEHVGVLILPIGHKSDQRLPLVVGGYHCRGFLEGISGMTVSPFVLANDGFAVLCSDMDFRLGASEEYPGRMFGPGQQIIDMSIMLDSWRSGVKALAQDELIDESRVGVSGLSFGAESVWYALTHSRFISVAAVQSPPWMDPFNYFLLGTASFNQFDFRGMPDPTTRTASAFYAEASGALNVRRIAAPVLEQDNEGEFISGMETYTEMNAFRKPYEVYIFPDESHEWVQPRHIEVIQDRTTDWFRFWLQGYEDSAPGKRGQYQRWKKLCKVQESEGNGNHTRCAGAVLSQERGVH